MHSQPDTITRLANHSGELESVPIRHPRQRVVVMRDVLCDFLFSKGYFVSHGEERHAPATLAALAKLFNIRIAANPGWANPSMVRIAKRNLGMDVPLPFYKGFPNSVLALSMEEVVADRLLHYLRTYGMGDFSQPGYSLFEDEVVRRCFDEKVEVRELSIIGEAEAIELLNGIVGSLLASTRPLNDVHYALVRTYIEEFLLESASYFDASAEGFYHGLVLGMISFMRDVYVITSNRESGYGRFDIMLKPRAEHRDFPAVVIEVKAAKTEADDLDALAAEARHQIDEKNYAALLVAEGITDIMKFGIAFFAKRAAIAK